MLKEVIPEGTKRLVKRAMNMPAQVSFALAAKGHLLSENQRRIKEMQQRHTGQRAFVIGSGPSIGRMDLRPLKTEITFGSNRFYLAEKEIGFLPSYLTVEDNYRAEDFADELNALSGTNKIFAHDLRYCLKPDDETTYVFFDRYYLDHEDERFPLFSPNALRRVYWGGTVLFMSLQLAFFMGIRRVYLLGVDLTYGSENENSESDHFHPDYEGNEARSRDPRVNRQIEAFETAAAFYEKHGGQVLNATPGGNLNSLKRVDFASIVE